MTVWPNKSPEPTTIGTFNCPGRFELFISLVAGGSAFIVRPLHTTTIMSATDTAKEIIRIGSTAGLSKDVIDLMEKKLALLTSENAELKTKVSAFEIEVRQLRRQLEDFQPVSKPGHLCPHCRRNTGDFIGNKQSHIMQEAMLGLERAYYKCSNPQCKKEFNEEIK
jgi:hypothetical protein